MVVIGLGQAGSNIASCFSKKYRKILITADDFPKTCKKTEDYETKCPSFSKKLSFKQKKCWFIVCGAGKVAGATLRILEKLKNKEINVIYIYPDPIMSTPLQLKRNRVVFNVLQEYTRSGLLNSIYLVSNKQAETFGSNSISNYYSALDSIVANVVETIDYFNAEKPVLGNMHNFKEISRIRTFGLGSVEKNEEKLLFPLDNTTETCYIYSISEEEIENESDLLSVIKQKITNDKQTNITSSFTVFSSLYNKSFYYSIKCTHYIQLEET
jgi:hypothetical protein